MDSEGPEIIKEIEPMLTLREDACPLHVPSNTAKQWSDRGIIRVYRIGQRGDRIFRRKVML